MFQYLQIPPFYVYCQIRLLANSAPPARAPPVPPMDPPSGLMLCRAPPEASLGEWVGAAPPPPPSDTIQGGDILMKVFLRLNLQEHFFLYDAVS